MKGRRRCEERRRGGGGVRRGGEENEKPWRSVGVVEGRQERKGKIIMRRK